MVVPIGHSKFAKYKLSKKYMRCAKTRREVDFEALTSILDPGQAPHAEVDELPLDLVARAWNAR